MVTFEPRPAPAGGIRIEVPYVLTGAADIRDARRSKFEPLEGTVTFVDGRPWWVHFKGRRHNERRTWTEGGFGIEADGSVRRNAAGELPPPIVDALIEDARQHPAVHACLAAVSA